MAAGRAGAQRQASARTAGSAWRNRLAAFSSGRTTPSRAAAIARGWTVHDILAQNTRTAFAASAPPISVSTSSKLQHSFVWLEPIPPPRPAQTSGSRAQRRFRFAGELRFRDRMWSCRPRIRRDRPVPNYDPSIRERSCLRWVQSVRWHPCGSSVSCGNRQPFVGSSFLKLFSSPPLPK